MAKEGSALTLACLGGGFLPSSCVGAVLHIPCLWTGIVGSQDPRSHHLCQHAAVCPDLVCRGCHVLERVVAEMLASGNLWREMSWYLSFKVGLQR